MGTTEKQYLYVCKRDVGHTVEVRSEVHTAATMSSTTVCGVTPYSLVYIYRLLIKHTAFIFKPS
jgi:hypothetical protein